MEKIVLESLIFLFLKENILRRFLVKIVSSRIFLFWWCIVDDNSYRHNVLSKRIISLEADKVTWNHP